MQRTFSIIKPDAFRKGYSAAMLAEIDKAGFKIVAIKKMFLSKSQAQGFYAVHAQRPFFDSLTSFMSSGSDHRHGAGEGERDRRFAQADGRHQPGQRRRRHHPQAVRRSIEENAIHGSDAEDTAAFEIGYFFAGYELA